MVGLLELWLPILLSGVFVFVASSVIHMFLPIHRGDFRKIAGEANVLEAMRGQDVKPGEYMFPCSASMKDMSSPEMQEKYRQGPVGFLTIVPNGTGNMGKNLLQWFAFSIVVSVFVAYADTLALASGAGFEEVFRLTSVVAILGYSVTNVTNSIWKGVCWIITTKFIFDGIVYGLTTAATFAWLWPDGA